MKNVLASSLVALLAVACGGSDDADPAVQTPSDPDGGPVVVVPPDAPPIAGGCDVAKLPTEDACVLHESIGVFVSSARGADANDGSRLRPYGTIAKGIEAAQATHRRVYVCAENYTEPTLALADGVSVFGNLTCAGTDWAVTNLHSVVNAVTSPAVRATDIVSATRIEGLDLAAPDGVASGESSIGLIAVNSNGLSFVRSRIVAQKGAAGANGTEGTQLEQDAAFTGGTPRPEGACTENPFGTNRFTCPTLGRAPGGVGVCRGNGREVTTGPGGEGGASSPYERVGTKVPYTYNRTQTRCYHLEGTPDCSVWTSPESGLPTVATAATNTGGILTYPADGPGAGTLVSQALAGGVVASGPTGANAGKLLGLGAEGFAPLDGVAGGDGAPGQGGGGGWGGFPFIGNVGAAAFSVGVSGPGGGAGGCPGLAGTAGKGGGASIGILAIGSAVHLEATSVVAAQAGLGGKGTLGSLPTPGGAPGPSGMSAAGAGGAGGAAGWSGHGASGPSLGIAWNGAEPVLSADSTAEAGPARDGQPALTGTGKTIPAGGAGIAENVHAF